jgi:NAD(P)H-dependent flavin oxidoreductase YrpB (nitropropane dioxygenase family)
LLGIEHPIIAAPMGPDLTGPELVAAVSNAGGLGILQAQLTPPPLFRREIQRVRELTDKTFGVNLILHFPVECARSNPPEKLFASWWMKRERSFPV